MGSITVPFLTMTLGNVEFWNVSLVVHSGPIGPRRLRSYWSFDSKGWGRDVALYLTLYVAILVTLKSLPRRRWRGSRGYLFNTSFVDDDGS